MKASRQGNGFLVLVLCSTSLLHKTADAQLITANFFKSICGDRVPQIGAPYTSLAARSRVRCVGLCNLDPNCVLVKFRAPTSCFLTASKEYNCTENERPPGNSFYVLEVPATTATSQALTSCETGWFSFESSCYWVDQVGIYDRSDAAAYCTGLRMGGHLVAFNEEPELLYVEQHIESLLSPVFLQRSFWTSGVRDLLNSPNFAWDDGSGFTGEPMTLNFHWMAGQPNNGATGDDANLENSVSLVYNYGPWGFNDRASHHELHVICEYEQ